MKNTKKFDTILGGWMGRGGRMDFEGAQEYIGIRVHNERKRAKLSQENLAIKARVGVKVIGKIENYKGNPTLKTLGKIAKSLGLGIEKLCPSENHRNLKKSYKQEG